MKGKEMEREAAKSNDSFEQFKDDMHEIVKRYYLCKLDDIEALFEVAKLQAKAMNSGVSDKQIKKFIKENDTLVSFKDYSRDRVRMSEQIADLVREIGFNKVSREAKINTRSLSYCIKEPKKVTVEKLQEYLFRIKKLEQKTV